MSDILPWGDVDLGAAPAPPPAAPTPTAPKAPAQQIMLPWGQYRVAELARVVGASWGATAAALARLGILNGRARGVGIPADVTDRVKAEVERAAAETQARRNNTIGRKLDKRRQKMERIEARDRQKALRRVGL